MTQFFRHLRRDENGTTFIETAVLLPVLLMMLIGVMQAGMYLQAQNAVRSISGEMSRYMAVEAQKGSAFTNGQVETKALSMAVTAPYLLKSENLQVDVTDEESQSMDRIRKVAMRIQYDVPNILGFTDVSMLSLDYERAIFLPGTPMPTPSPTATETGTPLPG